MNATVQLLAGLLALAVLVLPWGAGARAQEALTDAQVTKALAAIEALRPLQEKYGAEIAEYARTVKRPDDGERRDPCEITAEVRGAPGFTEMEKVVRKSGFKSGEEFCRVMDRVMRAYTALRVDEQRPRLEQEFSQAGPNLQQQVAEMRQRIENDDKLSQEQKQQYLAQLDQQQAQMQQQLAQMSEHPMISAARTVPEGDKAVVAAHRGQLEQQLQQAQQ
jgi:hypothetical protein